MSFPNIVYGDYGDEKRAQSTKIGGMPLGITMVLPDKRAYIHGKASTAAALSAGYLCCGSRITDAGTSAGSGITAASAVVGATSLVVTVGGTAFVANQWNEGWMVGASSSGAGIGRLYKVKSSNSAAAAATTTISLYEEDALVTAIDGGTTKVGFVENTLNNVVVTPVATSLPGPFAGVAQVAISAGFYAWFQTRGACPAYQATGTALVVGDQVSAATGYAGAFGVVAATGAAWQARSKMLGEVLNIAGTEGFQIINLRLD